MKRLLQLVILLGLSIAAHAATTRYVTPTGSDSNPCTLASPCATPTHADSIASPDDVVNVASGVYSYGGAAATFATGGTVGHPITITCATRGTCKITNTVTGNSTVLYLHAANLVFDGFEVTNTGAGNNLGIFIDASNVSVTRSIIHDIQTDCGSNGGGGIQVFTNPYTGILLDSNQIYNISWVSGAPKCPSTTVQTDGILAENTSGTATITNNLVYNTSGGWGIGTSAQAVIANNTIFNTVNGGVVINNAPAGVAVQNNVIVYTGLLASDSSFYGGACGIQNGTGSTTTYSNNFMFGNHGGNYGQSFGCNPATTHTGDVYTPDPAGGSIFINWQQNGTGDYHEKTGSATIAAGTSANAPNHDFDSNPRPSGAGFDMGAYQFTHQTWWVRADGGSRYSVNVAGQCNGEYDAPYPGTGTNQNCAFNDVRYLWTDASYNADSGAGAPKWGWIGATGDTYIIGTCIQQSAPNVPIPGSSGPCRVGQSGPNSGDGFGLFGDPFSAGAPQPIAGTRILGANWASCNSPGMKSLVYGGYGVGGVFSATNNNVDIECIEISDQSTCSRASSLSTDPCNTGFPLDDYASNGIIFNRAFTNVSVKNVYVHGTAHDCFAGSTGDGTVLTNVSGSGCPDSGWNMDPGDGTTGTGHLILNNFNLSFAGFAEIFPINHANDITFPWGTVGQVTDGTDQNVGGYGDGLGTATVQSNPAWIMAVHHSSIAYSTQDGFDLLHLQGNGSTISIDTSLAYGNMGQQFKLGAAGSITNSISVGNCNALKTLPGLSPTAATQLSLYCRAGDSAIAMQVNDGATTTYAFNTMYTASTDAIEVVNACTGITCVLNYQNNIMVGFLNSVANGYYSGVARNQNPNPMFFDNPGDPFSFGGSLYTNNATFNQLATTPCPNTGLGEVNALCTSPQLTDMTWHLYGLGNMAPASGSSAVIGAGVAIAGITTDYFNTARANPPTIGAIEASGSTPTITGIAVTPNPGAVSVTGTLAMTCTATYSDFTTSACPTPTWSGTGAHSTIDSSTGIVTGVSAGSDTITANSSGFNANATVNVSALPIVATPTASPAAGTYTTPQTVSLLDATSGATKCYRTDGPTPTAPTPGTCGAGSFTYSTPLTVSVNTTIIAIGTKAGSTNSSPATFAYTITPVPTLVSITVRPNPASVTTSGTVNMQTASFCTFSDSSTVAAGATGCVVVWSSTAAHSSINASTGIVTGTTAGSDTVTATLAPATPANATVNITAAAMSVNGISSFSGTTSSPH